MRATRPDDVADASTERALARSRLALVWQQQVDRVTAALGPEDGLPDVAGAFDAAAEEVALEPVLRAHLQRCAVAGAAEVLATWDPAATGWSPDMVEPWIARAAQTDAHRWCAGVTSRLADAVRDTEHADENVRAVLADDRIAASLTETFVSEAVAFGGQDAATKSGLDEKAWRTASGCPVTTHADADGEAAPITGLFTNGLRWPGDFAGDSAQTFGCTCRLTYGRADQ